MLKQITKQSFILCNKCSVIFCNSQQEFVVLDFLNNQYQIKYEEFLNSYKRHITKEPEILLRKLVRENKEILKEITSHLFSTKRKKINYSQVFSKIIDEIDVFLKNGVTENFEDKAKNFFININNIFIEKNYIINLFEQCQKSISYKYRILNNKDEDQTKINSRINEYRKDQLDILKYIEVHLLKHIEENLKFYQNKDNHLKIILNNILIYLNLENSIENFRLLQFWAKSKEKKEGQRIRIDLIFNIIFQY